MDDAEILNNQKSSACYYAFPVRCICNEYSATTNISNVKEMKKREGERERKWYIWIVHLQTTQTVNCSECLPRIFFLCLLSIWLRQMSNEGSIQEIFMVSNEHDIKKNARLLGKGIQHIFVLELLYFSCFYEMYTTQELCKIVMLMVILEWHE